MDDLIEVIIPDLTPARPTRPHLYLRQVQVPGTLRQKHAKHVPKYDGEGTLESNFFVVFGEGRGGACRG